MEREREEVGSFLAVQYTNDTRSTPWSVCVDSERVVRGEAQRLEHDTQPPVKYMRLTNPFHRCFPYPIRALCPLVLLPPLLPLRRYRGRVGLSRWMKSSGWWSPHNTTYPRGRCVCCRAVTRRGTTEGRYTRRRRRASMELCGRWTGAITL